jgi:hypothetical protein
MKLLGADADFFCRLARARSACSEYFETPLGDVIFIAIIREYKIRENLKFT